MIVLETDRLLLRTWEARHIAGMCTINADPKVMEHFPALQTEEETYALVERCKNQYEQHGYSLYACERKDSQTFIGFIGLNRVGFQAHFTPAVEIGWRLAASEWGQGFATEGAKAVLQYAFTELVLPEIVSFTALLNQRSIRAMEKIGLQHNSDDDFDHPKLAEDSPLRPHVLYRLRREAFIQLK